MTPGRFQIADGGTIFLDEIGDLSLDLQPKLLRVQEGRRGLGCFHDAPEFRAMVALEPAWSAASRTAAPRPG
jgi:hypothetical protein